jgi:hypothetical protein
MSVSLECNCCGGGTRGRQWWNRDDGYGICVRCAEEQIEKYGLDYVENCNGKRGVHWDVNGKEAIVKDITEGRVYFFEISLGGVVHSCEGGQAVFATTETEAEIRLRDYLAKCGPSSRFEFKLLRSIPDRRKPRDRRADERGGRRDADYKESAS